MKSILPLISKGIFLFLTLLITHLSFGQITSPTASSTVSTAYTLVPAIPNDNIYVFCLPNQSTTDIGSLTASAPSGTGEYTILQHGRLMHIHLVLEQHLQLIT